LVEDQIFTGEGRMINTDMTIGQIIAKKGTVAGELMDRYFCDDGERVCCPGTSLVLDYAANIKAKTDILPKLLEELNALPDIR
jgi:hypothetical protein